MLIQIFFVVCLWFVFFLLLFLLSWAYVSFAFISKLFAKIFIQ